MGTTDRGPINIGMRHAQSLSSLNSGKLSNTFAGWTPLLPGEQKGAQQVLKPMAKRPQRSRSLPENLDQAPDIDEFTAWSEATHQQLPSDLLEADGDPFVEWSVSSRRSSLDLGVVSEDTDVDDLPDTVSGSSFADIQPAPLSEEAPSFIVTDSMDGMSLAELSGVEATFRAESLALLGDDLPIGDAAREVLPKLLEGFWKADLVDAHGHVSDAYAADLQVFSSAISDLTSVKESGVLDEANSGGLLKADGLAMAVLAKLIYNPDMSMDRLLTVIKAGQDVLNGQGPMSKAAKKGIQWLIQFSADSMFERGGRRLLFGQDQVSVSGEYKAPKQTPKDLKRMQLFSRQMALASKRMWSTHSKALGMSPKGIGNRADFDADHAGESPFALETLLHIVGHASVDNKSAVQADVSRILQKRARSSNNGPVFVESTTPIKEQLIWCLGHQRMNAGSFQLDMRDTMEAALANLLLDDKSAILETFGVDSLDDFNTGELAFTVFDHLRSTNRVSQSGKWSSRAKPSALNPHEVFSRDFFTEERFPGLRAQGAEFQDRLRDLNAFLLTVTKHVLGRFYPPGGKAEAQYNAMLEQSFAMAEASVSEGAVQTPLHNYFKCEQIGGESDRHRKIHVNPLRQVKKMKVVFGENGIKPSPLKRAKRGFLSAMAAVTGQKKPKHVKQKEHASEMRKEVKPKAFKSESLGITGSMAKAVMKQLKADGLIESKGVGKSIVWRKSPGSTMVVSPKVDFHLMSDEDVTDRLANVHQLFLDKFGESEENSPKADAAVAKVKTVLQSTMSITERIFSLAQRRGGDDLQLGHKARFSLKPGEFKVRERALKSGDGQILSVSQGLKKVMADFETAEIPAAVDALNALALDSTLPEAERQYKSRDYIVTTFSTSGVLSGVESPALRRDIRAMAEIILQLRQLQPGVHPLEGTFEGAEKMVTHRYRPQAFAESTV